MSVERLGRECDSQELSGWMAYDRVHPLPDPWVQTGVQASLMANLWKGPKDKKKYKPSDFMPSSKKARKKMSPEQMSSALRRMCGVVVVKEAEPSR